MDLKKAKLLDRILLKFAGNATIKWNDLRDGHWDDIASYHVCENNINFLVGDGMIKRESAILALSLTDKGLAVMTDIPNLGYAKKTKKEIFDACVKYVAIATFFILIYNTFLKKSNDYLQRKENHQGIDTLQPRQDNKLHDSTSRLPLDTVDQIHITDTIQQ